MCQSSCRILKSSQTDPANKLISYLLDPYLLSMSHSTEERLYLYTNKTWKLQQSHAQLSRPWVFNLKKRNSKECLNILKLKLDKDSCTNHPFVAPKMHPGNGNGE